MAKLTISDLKKIKERHQSTFTLREGGYRAKVTVHMGTCGIAAGARSIVNALMEEIDKNAISDIIVTTSGCAGLCSSEPMVTVEIVDNPPVKYKELTDEKIREIFREHIVGGKIVDKYALVIGSETTY
jgi:NADP-reducing hydrogenase subunit HndB